MPQTYFPPENGPLPAQGLHASQELYEDANRNFTIGYSDVVLRNPETGEFFFPTRAVEPEKDSIWFIGGRIAVGETTGESAARHVQDDTGLSIPSHRFSEVSHFGIAHTTEREGQEPMFRHAQNTVLVAHLTPDEVEALNSVVSEGKLNSEYSGGEWYNPETGNKELSGPLRQFLRDYFSHGVMMDAIHDQAEEEYAQRFGVKPSKSS